MGQNSQLGKISKLVKHLTSAQQNNNNNNIPDEIAEYSRKYKFLSHYYYQQVKLPKRL